MAGNSATARAEYLEPRLHDAIVYAAKMVARENDKLSRQSIAGIITAWMLTHPGAEPYETRDTK
jgi:hypothetical protein